MAERPVPISEIAGDPLWFPVDLDIDRGCIHFLHLGVDELEQAAFLDSRLPLAWEKAQAIDLHLLRDFVRPASISWLWHTSFCGSTLMARLLHRPTQAFSLREPLALRRLSDAKDRGKPVSEWLPTVLWLLSRPQRPGEAVVVKPTHAALNIASESIRVAQPRRFVLLTSSLDDFLVSHLKKTPETLAKIPALAERALAAGDLPGRLDRSALEPPNVLASAAIQWAAQREIIADLLQSDSGTRGLVVDWQAFQDDMATTLGEAARWLELPMDGRTVSEQVSRHGGRHAKAANLPYDATRRQEEVGILRERYREPLDIALNWAERHLLPAMRRQAIAPGMPDA